MTTEWFVTQKPDFFKALLALPPKEMHQVMEKVGMLTQDPTPDAKVKKQLKYMNGKLHRIRSGDYRIFYTFEQPYISILALRRRDDDTYDEDLDSQTPHRYSEGLASGLHRNSAYLVRRAALASWSDTSGATDNCPVLTQSCRMRPVRIAIFLAPIKSEWSEYARPVRT